MNYKNIWKAIKGIIKRQPGSILIVASGMPKCKNDWYKERGNNDK